MSWIRLLSSGLVFSGFLLYGRISALRCAQKAECIAGLCAELELMESSLELLRPPLETLCEDAAEHAVNTRFWQTSAMALKQGNTPAEAYSLAEQYLSCKEALPVLGELFAKIGSSDAETELKRIKNAETSLKIKAEVLAAESAKSTKLRSSLSVMMGLAAALILL